MSRIRVLPDELASQVAAGEVVERPASVVKELVENSLDAGAGRIEVRIDRGGISLIRVIDDGEGMDRDDALLSVERHATSKLRESGELSTVRTMGFRGEALPSIASVSRFVLRTRRHGDAAGVEVKVNGGRIVSVGDSGEAPGTQVEVRNLFFNVPARRKFLRTEQTEAAHVEHQLHALAIGHWRVGMTYMRDGRIVFRLPPARTLKERLAELWGRHVADDLVEVGGGVASGGVVVEGFAGRTETRGASRGAQFVYVNGRVVESREVQYGIRHGYGPSLPRGRHPQVALFLEVPAGEVDVNVHPAKREVRFRNGMRIQDAVAERVGSALSGAGGASGQSVSQGGGLGGRGGVLDRRDGGLGDGGDGWQPKAAPSASPAVETTTEPYEAGTMRSASVVPPLRAAPLPDPEFPVATGGSFHSAVRPADSDMRPGIPDDFRLLSRLSDRYVLIECADGMVVMDTVLSRRRIVFEQVLRQLSGEGVGGQRLLMPPVVEYPARDADWLRERLPVLARCGVVLEEFGANTFKLDSLPAHLDNSDPERALDGLLEEIRDGNLPSSRGVPGDEVVARAVARRSVEPGGAWKLDDARRWLEQLMRCDLPYCDPDGRPTMIHMSFREIAKRFT